jgi:hypothetical protein
VGSSSSIEATVAWAPSAHAPRSGGGLGGDQRHVAVEDEHGLVAEVRGRGLHGAAGLAWAWLHRELHAFGQLPVERPLRAVDHDDLPRAGAASAAATGQAIMAARRGRAGPWACASACGCPGPRARMTTVGAVTGGC